MKRIIDGILKASKPFIPLVGSFLQAIILALLTVMLVGLLLRLEARLNGQSIAKDVYVYAS